MSMKRTKKASGSTRGGASDGSLGFNPPSTEVPTWDTAVGALESETFTTYAPITIARSRLTREPV